MTMHKNHGTSSAANLQRFNFHGDELDVIPNGATVHVSARRVCEALGVDYSRQLRKLKSDPSMGVAMMSIPSPGGSQETACIELHSLPLWLATIHPSKVKPAVRGKLVAYRRECADVLADHFLGRRGANDPGQIATAITAAVTPIARAVEQMARILDSQGRRLDALEAERNIKPANDAPTIGAAGAAKVLGTLRSIAATKAGAIGQGGVAKVKARIRFIEERSLRRELRYPMDRGCSWSKLTTEQLGRATLILERMTAEAEDIARLAARDAGPLFRAVPKTA